MKKCLSLLSFLLLLLCQLQAQVEPSAGSWKTWFISSGKAYRLPAPASYKNEIAEVIARQHNIDSVTMQHILYWNAESPEYRWQNFMYKLWTVDTGRYGALANMLLGTATYDATIAAWDTKYAYNRPRPFAADSRIKVFVVKPESPSFPCEHSVAAGVAVAVISHFYPAFADSVKRMAEEMMASRVAAGTAFPSDTRAGYELGKRIAEKEIEETKDYVSTEIWDGKIPEGPDRWHGRFAMLPMAGHNKTVVLKSGSELRPPPPPDFAKDMAEMKNFKRTLKSNTNAYNYASGFGDDQLHQKLMEYNLHLNPPRAARIYATLAVAMYDGFVSCWDAKYAYWGIRPDQYDTTYKSLLQTPPFPGYPSGHAMLGSVTCEVLSYFFPADRPVFEKRAKDGAESRFQAGIHFRTDNEVALDLGKKVGTRIIEKIKGDGADTNNVITAKKTDKNDQKTSKAY
jgi:membrane-associated phospholipid phosphatase